MKRPVATRLSLLSPELTLAVTPAKLRALLESAFAPDAARLVPASARAVSLATARALWARKMPAPAADVLDDLALFATPAGRDAILEAARDVRSQADGWEDLPPVDLAAMLLADDMAKDLVLVRAALRLGRMPLPRATYEVRAAEPRAFAPERLPRLVEALRAAASGPRRLWSDAWVHEDDHGDLHAVLLHAGPCEDASNVGRRPERAARRPLHVDAFRFRVSEGRLAITPTRPQSVDEHAAVWGEALYEDASFFERAPSLTLKPLQALGAAGLASAKLPREVRRARVIACHLDTGGPERIEAYGPGALAKIEPHLRAGGHLARATIRFDVAGEVRPVDAILHLPYRVDIGPGGVAASGARGPRLAREALEALGVFSPGRIDDDVTTLLPLVHPEWRWREIAGRDGVAAMRAAGVLEEIAGPETRRASIANLRRVGRSAIAYPLYRVLEQFGRPSPDAPGVESDLVPALERLSERLRSITDYYVVPDDWAYPAATVRQEHMAMLRLSLGALVRKARREMGLERGEKPKLPKGVLWVGQLAVEGGVVKFFYVVRAATTEKERAAVGKAIARASGFARAVVFVPAGRKMGRDYVEIELGVREQLGAASWRARGRDALRALEIEDRAPAELRVEDSVRLVVDSARERVSLDGVVLGSMGESGYRLLRALAERDGGAQPVRTRETDKAISGARASDGATRNVVWRMRGWVEKSFKEAGKRVPEDVKEAGLVRAVGRKGWKMTVRGKVT